jgi:hypothetical protein
LETAVVLTLFVVATFAASVLAGAAIAVPPARNAVATNAAMNLFNR